MTTQEIVSKLWNLCNVLRDDGITYHQYVTELTYILFLKMAKETGAESQIPVAYRWDQLTAKSGIELKKFYKELLTHLGENCTGRVREIYQGSATNIDEPKNLEKIITTIDGLDWYSAREEGLGNLYEGLLEKNANEKKSGAGQYFTPRVLIDVMTRLMKPQPGERCNDKTTPRLIQFHILKNAVNPPFLGGFLFSPLWRHRQNGILARTDYTFWRYSVTIEKLSLQSRAIVKMYKNVRVRLKGLTLD